MTIYYKGMDNGNKKIMSKLYKPIVIILLTICSLALTLIAFMRYNVPVAPMIQTKIIYCTLFWIACRVFVLVNKPF